MVSQSDIAVMLNSAKWVKGNLYMAMTGHTRNTLQRNKNNGTWVEGLHYKTGPEGNKTYYYNVEAIDKLISSHGVNNRGSHG